MSETYLLVAGSMGWLLRCIEDAIELLPAGYLIDRTFRSKLDINRPVTEEEFLASLKALTSVGLLSKTKHGYRLNSESVDTKLAYCRGIQEALNWKKQMD